MTKEQYEKLNEYLNDLFLDIHNNSNFYFDNLPALAYLTNTLSFRLDDYSFKEKVIENHLSYIDIIQLSKEILNNINPDYSTKLEEMIDNGKIDIIFSNISKIHQLISQNDTDENYYDRITKFENEIDGYDFVYKDNRCFNFEDGSSFINVVREYNYNDVLSIVHELIHSTNHTGTFYINRKMLTEFLSIYYEEKARLYLMEKKINPDEIKIFARFEDMDNCINKINSFITVLVAYQTFGNLNEESYKCMNDNFCKITKEEFDDESIELLNIIENLESKNKMQGNHYLRDTLFEYFVSPFKYAIGTIFAIYALNNCDENKILYLNEHINDEFSESEILEILKFIGIDLFDSDMSEILIDETINYLEKLKNYKEEYLWKK